MLMIIDFLKLGIYIKRWIVLLLVSIILIFVFLIKSIDVFNVLVVFCIFLCIGLFILGIGVFLILLMGLIKGFIRFLNKSLLYRIS